MSRMIFRLFLFLLIFSPLAFGTVEPWSFAILETSALFALVLLIFRNRRTPGRFFSEVPGFVPLMLFSAWIVFQIVPLPPWLVKLISPGTYALSQESVWLSEQGKWTTLSLYQKGTITEFFRTAAYAATYILTVQLLRKKNRLQTTVGVIIVFGTVLAFLAILQDFLADRKIFWLRELTAGGIPYGPFVNRNHYAGFMGMLFPVVLSMFLFYKPAVAYGSLRERISDAFNQHRTHLHILLGFSALIIATSIFLSLSRGGIMSLSISMLFFGGMILKRRGQKKQGLLIILVVILVFYSVGWFGWAPIFKRFEDIRNMRGDIAEMRFDIWKDSMKIIRDFPLTGTGFGSFVHIYAKYRTVVTDKIVDHAHNDYIELTASGGVIASSLALWFLAEVLFRSYRVSIRRRDPYSVYLFTGSVTGMCSILVHGITDFNLHIGSNGLYFFFLAGLIVSAANTRLQDSEAVTSLRKAPAHFQPVAGPVAVILLLLSLTFHFGVLAGRFQFSLIRDADLNAGLSAHELDRIRDRASRASSLDPFEAAYHYVIANTAWLLSDKADALIHYRRAVELDRSNGEYLQALGMVLSGKDPDAAEKLLRAGTASDANNPERHRRYAAWLLSQGRKEEGLSVIKTAISLDPGNTRRNVALLVLNGIRDEDIHRALPEMAGPHMLFAAYLSKTGKDDLAGEEYLHALDYMQHEPEKTAAYFTQACHFFLKREDYDNALKVMRKAVETLPGHVSIRFLLAQTYEKAGIPYRALEEYRHVLLLDPRNDNARKRLSALQ